MTEENGTDDKSGKTSESTDEFKPITSQEDLNKLIGARINQVKSQYADYEDVKAKAAKFDEVEQASKSELQKERERAEQAERERDEARQESLRARVAAEKGVPASALTGATQEELEKAADALIAWRGEQAKAKPPLSSLKSGSAGGDNSGMSAKEKAVAALRSATN